MTKISSSLIPSGAFAEVDADSVRAAMRELAGPLVYWQGGYHSFERVIGNPGARWASRQVHRGEGERDDHARDQADRLSGFSDGVFAVIITILVLELKPPHSPSFAALISLWPTALSYAVSYPFIAIV